MSVNAKVLMCTAALCVAGVRAEGDNWEDNFKTTANSESTPEGTTEPIVPLPPVNGEVTPVPPVANQVVMEIDFKLEGDFSDCFYANETPKSTCVHAVRKDLTQGARNLSSNDTSRIEELENCTLIDSFKNGSVKADTRMIFSPDQFDGTPEQQIQAVKDLAASVESLSANDLLGEQRSIMGATGATSKFSVTGLTVSREGTAAPSASGASANGVAVMVGALFAALVAL